MTNKPQSFPSWFDWEDYKFLSELDDHSKWAYLFAVRDKSFKNERAKGLGIYRRQNPISALEEIPSLFWQNGVLSHGTKGHETHNYLYRVVAHAARNATFIPAEEFKKLQNAKRLKKGAHYVTNGIINYIFKQPGRLEFSDEQSFEEYRTIENAIFGGTIELALNIFTPKKALLKEIERTIDKAQHNFLMDIERKKVQSETSLMWSRGLACWDLEKYMKNRYQIAKHLVPIWKKETLGDGPPSDQDKKDVREAINAVKPFINGGWRALSGDPIGTIGEGFTLATDLLERKVKIGG